MAKRVFSLQEAAEYLNLGVSTLHIAIAPNTKQTDNLALIPPHFERIGLRGTVVFLREDLDAWRRVNSKVAKRRRKPGKPIASRLVPEVAASDPEALAYGQV